MKREQIARELLRIAKEITDTDIRKGIADEMFAHVKKYGTVKASLRNNKKESVIDARSKIDNSRWRFSIAEVANDNRFLLSWNVNVSYTFKEVKGKKVITVDEPRDVYKVFRYSVLIPLSEYDQRFDPDSKTRPRSV